MADLPSRVGDVHPLMLEMSLPDSGYGLDRRSWVTALVATVPDEEHEVLLDFVEESYRAIATETLVERLDAEITAQTD